MIEGQKKEIQDYKPLSINDDIPIQDVPINDFPIQDNREQQMSNALKQKSLAKNQQTNQQQNTPIYQPKADQAQQIQMLSNGISILQEELRTDQNISSGIGSILGTNSSTLKRITGGALQDTKNFLLGGVEYDLNNDIPLDGSKIKPEEVQLLQSYLDKLGIPYNAKKIKVRDMLQVYLAMSSDHFHKVNNLDLSSINKIKNILKYRNINNTSFVLTDAELEQIRQSAPDIFNKLQSSGCMTTMDNNLRRNEQLNASLANSLSKAYVSNKQERAENSSNAMLGITVASLLLSFSSILSACGVVLTGFLATVVSFFPIISLAIMVYTVIKKISSLANNIESYHNEDTMRSVESIGKISASQAREKQQQLNDQTIKNKVKIGMIQEQAKNPQLQNQTINNQQINRMPVKNNYNNTTNKNDGNKPAVETDNKVNNLKPILERSFEIKPEVEKEIQKKQTLQDNKQEKQEAVNNDMEKTLQMQQMSKMLLELNNQLADLEQKFQENVMQQENSLNQFAIKQPSKTKNKKTEKKTENKNNIQKTVSNIEQENLHDQSIITTNQDSNFMSQDTLQNFFSNDKQDVEVQHKNIQQSKSKQEELLKELLDKQQQLQYLLQQKEKLEQQEAIQNNDLNHNNNNSLQQPNTSNNGINLNNSFPWPENYKNKPYVSTMQVNPWANNHSNYKPTEDMYNIYNPNNNVELNNKNSEINQYSIPNKSQGYGQGY